MPGRHGAVRARAGTLAALVAIAILAALAPIGSQEPPPIVASASVAAISRQNDRPQPDALSARNANYDIDVRLDHATRTLTGTALIRWRNIGLAPADFLRMHMYWNAWRDTGSSWMRERALAGRAETDRPAGDWSYIDVTEIAYANPDGSAGADLLSGLAFVRPDDANLLDQTLLGISLPTPVYPGREIALRVGWRARVPRPFSRTGTVGDYYFIAHWFPKMAVFENARWTAHQFHANTEFFADYGRYDVRITVPRGWMVGATGREQSRADNADGTTTHRYVQDDVHDFAWTTSPDFVEHRDRFVHEGLPPVDIRLLLQPEHAGHEDRHFAATKAALRYYGEWYGPYPYGHITVVDPAYQSRSGGMEYPTLFTAGMNWLAPRQTNSPEAVTVHEAGHQFWYGMIGNNEFEHAWLDEGLNTFSEERVQSIAFQPNYRVERFFGGFIPWQFREIPLSRATDGGGLNGYRAAAESDDPSEPTFRYWPGTHANLSYFKTTLWLHTLERYLGWETLQRILSTFFERWKFRHPRPEDFFAVASEVSGQDLTWFFDQVHRSSNVFDYGVQAVDTAPRTIVGLNHDVPDPAFEERFADGIFRTTVVVRRYGEAFFPVDVVTRFGNVEEVREQWDGRERWRAYVYERRHPAAAVRVDPDRTLLLDVNYTNNSWAREPEGGRAARRWSLAWMVWLQDLLLTWAFFV